MKNKVFMVSLGLFLVSTLSHAEGGASPTIPARSRALNPDISANFLALYRLGSGLSDDPNTSPRAGFSLQEAELQFAADVDPYLRAVSRFGIAQESGSPDFSIDPEEVFVETLTIPSVTFKGGKFRSAFGKHNQLHAHAFPFIDAPVIYTQLTGDEGIAEVGLSGSVLLPTSWFSELTTQVTSASNTDLFNNATSRPVAVTGKLKNLFDLSDDLTMEIGLSGITAKNQYFGSSTLWGADLTFKWRPSVGGKYSAWIWSTEYLGANREGWVDTSGNPTDNLGGIASWIQWQFSERWWVQTRVESVGIHRSAAIAKTQKQSALLGFFPSEFSGFRVQYDHQTVEGVDEATHAVGLQYNISIGAHPAHSY